MELDQLIQTISTYRGPYPRGPVREAIARREEITPALLDMIAYTTANLDEVEERDDYMGHLMACYLLAQFREPRAYRPIIALFSLPGDRITDETGDFVTEDLNRVLASVYDGDLAPLKSLIENPAAGEWARAAALDALPNLVAQGALSRDEAMAYLIGLLREGLERAPSYAWDETVSVACDLYPEEALDDIHRAFEEGWVDRATIDEEWVEHTLALDKEAILQKLGQDPRRGYIEDTVAEMSDWYWFRDPANWPEGVSKEKPRRNQPCPCGSGLKYKHCCMRKG